MEKNDKVEMCLKQEVLPCTFLGKVNLWPSVGLFAETFFSGGAALNSVKSFPWIGHFTDLVDRAGAQAIHSLGGCEGHGAMLGPSKPPGRLMLRLG